MVYEGVNANMRIWRPRARQVETKWVQVHCGVPSTPGWSTLMSRFQHRWLPVGVAENCVGPSSDDIKCEYLVASAVTLNVQFEVAPSHV